MIKFSFQQNVYFCKVAWTSVTCIYIYIWADNLRGTEDTWQSQIQQRKSVQIEVETSIRQMVNNGHIPCSLTEVPYFGKNGHIPCSLTEVPYFGKNGHIPCSLTEVPYFEKMDYIYYIKNVQRFQVEPNTFN